MPLNSHGFTLINLPAPCDAVLGSFDRLQLDSYGGGKQRYRRFSQYRMMFAGERWHLELLPHRPYIQPRQYNKHAGGVLRHYEPLEIDPTFYVDSGARSVPLDTGMDWQVNVHQYRIIAEPGIRGVCVPEGRHQDGHPYIMIAVFAREGITGAETLLTPPDGEVPFFRDTLLAGQALVIRDNQMFHYTSDIEPVDERGHRDLSVVAFEPWENRWYGEKFERDALDLQ